MTKDIYLGLTTHALLLTTVEDIPEVVDAARADPITRFDNIPVYKTFAEADAALEHCNDGDYETWLRELSEIWGTYGEPDLSKILAMSKDERRSKLKWVLMRHLSTGHLREILRTQNLYDSQRCVARAILLSRVLPNLAHGTPWQRLETAARIVWKQ